MYSNCQDLTLMCLKICSPHSICICTRAAGVGGGLGGRGGFLEAHYHIDQ